MGGVGSGVPGGARRMRKDGRLTGRKTPNRTGRNIVESVSLSVEEDKAFHDACIKAGISYSSGVRILMAYASQGFSDWRAFEAKGMDAYLGHSRLTDEERAARYEG